MVTAGSHKDMQKGGVGGLAAEGLAGAAGAVVGSKIRVQQGQQQMLVEEVSAPSGCSGLGFEQPEDLPEDDSAGSVEEAGRQAPVARQEEEEARGEDLTRLKIGRAHV